MYHSFLRGGGGLAISRKGGFLHSKNWWEILRSRSCEVLCLKNLFHTLLTTKKSHTQPQCDKKRHALGNCPTTTTPPSKKWWSFTNSTAPRSIYPPGLQFLLIDLSYAWRNTKKSNTSATSWYLEKGQKNEETMKLTRSHRVRNKVITKDPFLSLRTHVCLRHIRCHQNYWFCMVKRNGFTVRRAPESMFNYIK